jgi:hypothetical protein
MFPFGEREENLMVIIFKLIHKKLYSVSSFAFRYTILISLKNSYSKAIKY